MLKRREFSANMSAGGDVETKRVPFLRKNTPEERARMQNERRKRKRKARAAKKEVLKRVVLTLEDERAKATAKNERLLYLAGKYYVKWQTLHHREQVRMSFYVPCINIIIILSNVFRVLTQRNNYDNY